MCKVSHKIKFCSCKVTSVEKLKHYWIFHSYDSNKDVMILGETIPPYAIDEQIDFSNRKLLLKRVNEPGAFDIKLNPNNNDRLQLSFTCVNEIGGMIHYGFVFENGKWVEMEYDCMEWEWHHEEIEFGKMKWALEKNL